MLSAAIIRELREDHGNADKFIVFSMLYIIYMILLIIAFPQRPIVSLKPGRRGGGGGGGNA